MNPAVPAAEACQRAFYAALSGDATLLALATGGIYDQPPDTPAYPFVLVGDATEGLRNTFSGTGRDCACQVHIWTRSGNDAAVSGYGQAWQIAGRIDQLLDGLAPAVTDGWTFVSCWFETSHAMRTADGLGRHLQVTYRVMAKV